MTEWDLCRVSLTRVRALRFYFRALCDVVENDDPHANLSARA